MRTNIITFAGAIALIVTLAIGFAIVKPVLAQVAATSTTAAASSTSVAATVSAGTSTSDTFVASSTPPTSAPADSSATSTAASSTPADSSPGQGKAHASAEGVAHGKPPTDAPPPGFTEVHIIGTKYTDYFTDGSTTIAVPGDLNVDGNLDKPNAPIPTHAGMTWVHTTGENLYDTPSGDLEVGDYAVQSDSSYIQNAPPFVSSTSTPAQLPTSMANSAATDTSSSTNSVASPSIPDTSTSTATAPSDSASGTTTGSEPMTSGTP